MMHGMIYDEWMAFHFFRPSALKQPNPNVV